MEEDKFPCEMFSTVLYVWSLKIPFPLSNYFSPAVRTTETPKDEDGKKNPRFK